jgi:hypothetical protein
VTFFSDSSVPILVTESGYIFERDVAGKLESLRPRRNGPPLCVTLICATDEPAATVGLVGTVPSSEVDYTAAAIGSPNFLTANWDEGNRAWLRIANTA